MTIRDIAIAFGYEVDKKSESKAEQSIKSLKSTATKALGAIGIGFSIAKIISAVKSVDAVSDALDGVKNDWAEIGKEIDNSIGLTSMVVNGIKKVSTAATDLVRRITPRLTSIIKTFGGLQNLLKTVAIAGGAIYLAMNFSKIVSGLSSIMKLVGGINLKVLAIIAVIILLALLVEDFINFLQGNDSLFGTLLERAGVDTKKLRDTIFGIWESIRKFLGQVWDGIKGAAGATWDAITGFFSRHGERIIAILKRAWGFIQDLCSTVFGIIYDIIKGVFGDAESSVEKSQGNITGTIVDGWQKILDIVVPILDELFEVWDAVWSAILTVAEVVLDIVKKAWDKYGKNIIEGLRGVWSGIKKIIDGILTVIKGIATFVAGVFSGDWKKAWEGVKAIFSGVWKAIKGIFEAVISAIRTTIKNVATFIKGVWEGIKQVFSAVGDWFLGIFQAAWDNIVGVWSAVVGWFQSVWDGIVGIFSAVGTWFTDRFTEAWENIKGVFSAVGEFFQGVWDTIVGLFTSIGTAVGDAISGAVKGAINAVLSGAVAIINGFIKAINFAIGVINMIPGVNIKKLSEFEAPQLAEGGIVTKATRAIIGEGSEPEAVLPLSKLGGMISGYIKEAKEAIMKPGPDGTGNMAQTVMQAIKSVVSGMSTMVQAAKPSITTANNATTNNSRVSKSVTQNVNIKQEFNGDAAAQKNIAKAADSATEDTTSALARALEYAGG